MYKMVVEKWEDVHLTLMREVVKYLQGVSTVIFSSFSLSLLGDSQMTELV